MSVIDRFMSFEEAAKLLNVDEDYIRNSCVDLGLSKYCFRAFDGHREDDYMLERQEVERRFSAWKKIIKREL